MANPDDIIKQVEKAATAFANDPNNGFLTVHEKRAAKLGVEHGAMLEFNQPMMKEQDNDKTDE